MPIYKLQIVRILILSFCFFVFLFSGSSVLSTEPTDVYIFHMTGCPHSEAALRFLGELVKKYPTLSVKEFNLSTGGKEAFDLYFALADAYNLDVEKAPTSVLYVGERSWIGFDAAVAAQVEQEVVKCIAQACSSPADKLNGNTEKSGINGVSTSGLWIVWLIMVVGLGGIVFVVVKITRSSRK